MKCSCCYKEVKRREGITRSGGVIFCDATCEGSFWGKKSLEVDYGSVNCKRCGNNFKKRSSNQIYCSHDCRNNRQIGAQKCLTCKEEFVSSRKKKYCDTECRRKANRTVYKKECLRCGDEFISHDKRAKYCGVECYTVTKSCVGCNREYKTRDNERLYCTLKCFNDSNRKSHHEFCEELLEKHKGTIVPLEMYKGSDSLLKCMCVSCGNIMEKVTRFYIGSYSYGCNSCGSRSHGEDAIESWLRKNNIRYEKQYTFDDLRYIDKLLYDFAVFDNNDRLSMLIEYDGEQHFKPVDIFGGEESLQENIVRDEIKTNYAIETNTPLLRISYKQRNEISTILNDRILSAPMYG